MPTVVKYCGLSFNIYFDDHPPPHVHVKYGEYFLIIDLETLKPIKGYLPKSQRRLAIQIVKEKKNLFIEKFTEYSKINKDLVNI